MKSRQLFCTVALAVSANLRAASLILSGPEAILSFPPFFYQDQSGEFGGIIHKRIQCSANSMNTKITYQFLPAKRIMSTVKRGLADGFFPGSGGEKYKDFLPVGPIMDSPYIWVYKEGTPWQLPPTAASIGVLKNCSCLYFLKRSGYEELEQGNQMESLYKMLELGRIDAILIVQDAAKIIEKRLKSTAIKHRLAYENPIYLYINKNNPQLASLFNQAMKNCIKKDSLAKRKEN